VGGTTYTPTEDAMRTRITRAQLATSHGLPEDVAEICQRSLATREEMHPHLALNAELTPAVWYLIWGAKRPEASIAKGLVARELDAGQRALVITRENRIGVLREFLEHNELTLEEQQLLSGKANAAELLLKHRWVDTDLRKPLALKAKGVALLKEMALAPDATFTVEELTALVRTYPTWITDETDERERGLGARHRMLRILFGRHPRLIESVLDAIEAGDITAGRRCDDLLTAAAGSANLGSAEAARIARVTDGVCGLTGDELAARHYCLMALVNNPRCPLEVVGAVDDRVDPRYGSSDLRRACERRTQRAAYPQVTGPFAEVEDDVVLTWLVNRSVPGVNETTGRTRPGRPIEMLDLAANPHLDAWQRKRVVDGLRTDVETELIAGHLTAVRTIWPDVDEALADRQVTRRTWPIPEYLRVSLEEAARRLGTDPVRWETLIGLLDDFDGTFEEILEIVETI